MAIAKHPRLSGDFHVSIRILHPKTRSQETRFVQHIHAANTSEEVCFFN